MADQHYDAIFVGEGLLTLAAAATLSKQGKSVLLLRGQAETGQEIPGEAFQYSLGPFIYFGFEKWGAMEGFFSKLAYPIPSLKKKGLLFHPLETLLQVVLPNNRISLHSDEDAYYDELKREFSSRSENLKTLLGHMAREAAFYYPYVGQFPQIETEGVAERINEWKKYIDYSQAIQQHQKSRGIELLDTHGISPQVREYINLLFLCAFQRPLETSSAFELMQLFSSLKKGGVRFFDGLPTLVNFFHQLITAWGGTILSEGGTSKLDTRRADMEQLVLLKDGKVVTSPHIVIMKPVNKSRINFYFTLPNHIIPKPMNDVLLMTWDKNPPNTVEDLITIRLNPLKEDETASTNERFMTVSLLIRGEEQISELSRKYLQNRVMERLHWLIPFSEKKIKAITLPFKAKSSAAYFLSQNEWSGTTKEVMKGVFSYRQPKGRKNVYVVDSDRSNFMGWGTPFLAGHRLARLIDKSI